MLADTEIDFSKGDIFLDGENVKELIRTQEISQAASQCSAFASVRSKLVQLQQKMAASKSIIMDGRDIGTVVFPDAEIKIFMTADPKVRAMRRYREIIAKGESADFDEVLANVIERDRLDETRETAPLRRAPDAIFLDNSEMNMDDQIVWFVNNFSDRWNLKLK
jgi:cytidylate kinase